MGVSKADIIAQLHKQLLPLQGFRKITGSAAGEVDLGPANPHFPERTFPTGAVHEVIPGEPDDPAAGSGLVAGILAALMRSGGVALWISASRMLFPPALKAFGIEPERVIFIDLQGERELLWVMEEGLRCASLVAVVGELRDLDFTASRRLQLAVEKSQVTGFILRRSSKLNTSACVTRWRVTSLPSETADRLPGVGFPVWNVELLKVRNGKPGNWQLTWKDGKFQEVEPLAASVQELKKKIG